MKGEICQTKIIKKICRLRKSFLSDSEKKQVMDMLYKYKGTFSLRDEIGSCTNIEVEIDITDKSPFFTREYVKEEDKNILDKEMKVFFSISKSSYVN